jgi:hypothetical protein
MKSTQCKHTEIRGQLWPLNRNTGKTVGESSPTPLGKSSFAHNVKENVAISMRIRKARPENYLRSWVEAAKAEFAKLSNQCLRNIV